MMPALSFIITERLHNRISTKKQQKGSAAFLAKNDIYFTITLIPSLWLLNSGAYIH